MLFDKDGVLVDFHATWTPVMRDFAPEYAGGDRARADELLAIAGYDRATGRFKSGSIWAAGNTTELVAAWLPGGDAAQKGGLARQLDRACARAEPVALLDPEVMAEIFSGLRAQGLKVGMATNDSELAARRTLGAFGLEGLFDLVLGYDSVARPKPAADPVFAFCAHCGVAPHEVAMAGDNLHDMEMARNAGAGLAIGVLSGNASRAELATKADVLVETLAGVPDILTV